VMMAILRQGRNAISADVADDPQLADSESGQREKLLSLGTRALVATPLILRDTITGVIGVHQCSAPRQWQGSEVDLLQHLAGQVAVALDNARLFQESTQRAADLQVARDALAKSSAQLREKNQELEEFVYTVSHDLKAPLISIQSYLAALRGDYGDSLSAEARHFVERSESNARQLESLIADLLELSRIGREEAVWTEINTQRLVQEVVDELALQAAAKNVDIEIAPELPIIWCERKRLRQVFMNLIDNAIKYSDPAKTERWVRVECEERSNAWCFAVRDNGIGIEPRYLDKAFNIFTRVGKSKEPGSGVGLSIVRRIAEAHGGRAWAESSGAGQGTAFLFTVSKTRWHGGQGDGVSALPVAPEPRQLTQGVDQTAPRASMIAPVSASTNASVAAAPDGRTPHD
ncbi:MAG: HAMP domain-containing histidine kinase, partial [Armatimonadota bacterium]|nr:HAMP domain-containing histidine kinase [Armatimonadota bacterium]